MADILADYPVAAFVGNVLDGTGYVFYVCARYCRRDPRHQRQPRGRDESGHLGRRSSDEERPRSVAVVALPDRSGIDRNDLAVLDDPAAGDPVDDFLGE